MKKAMTTQEDLLEDTETSDSQAVTYHGHSWWGYLFAVSMRLYIFDWVLSLIHTKVCETWSAPRVCQVKEIRDPQWHWERGLNSQDNSCKPREWIILTYNIILLAACQVPTMHFLCNCNDDVSPIRKHIEWQDKKEGDDGLTDYWLISPSGRTAISRQISEKKRFR